MSGPVVMNAIISDVCMRLDRDCFLSGYVGLNRADGLYQSFGGYVLGGIPDVAAGKHDAQPNLAAMWMVGVMRAADVEDYAKAVGKAVRIKLADDGWNAKIIGFGHILTDDKWFSPEEAFAAARAARDEAAP